MGCDPTKHHRRSVRLRGYDYSTPGLYFVTLCTAQRHLLFGNVWEGQMRRNAAGEVIDHWWRELPVKFPPLGIDAYVIMPNHLHGVVILSTVPVGADRCVRPAPLLPRCVLPSLSRAIQWFKTMSTNEYLRNVKHEGWPLLPGRLWQRSYYEHVVRTERAFKQIRQYIVENPKNWNADPENPNRVVAVLDPIGEIIEGDTLNG